MQPLHAPESVDDSQDGEAGGDDDEALVLRGGPLRRDVLVLAPAGTIHHHQLVLINDDSLGKGELAHRLNTVLWMLSMLSASGSETRLTS